MMRSALMCGVAGMVSSALLLLAGCGDFFTKNSTGGGGGGGSNTGDYVYVGTQAGALASYSLSSTGALSVLAGSPFQLATSAINALTVTPGNAYLYAAVAGAGVFGLAINSSSGVPSLIKNSALAGDVSPLAMAVDPTGHFLLVAGLANGTAAVGEYSINSDGTLSELTGSPVSITFPGGTDLTLLTVQQIAIAPDSSYVFVSLGQLGVAPLPFNTGGGLSANTNIIPARTSTVGGATVANQDLGVAVDPTSKFLFMGETNAGVRVVAISPGSSFAEVKGSPFAGGGQPRSIVLDGTGANLYVANAADNTISGYAIQSSGALSPLTGSPFSSIGKQPNGLALDKTKKYLVSANLAGGPDVQVFSFDATTAGKLDAGAAATGNPASAAVATTH